jgi:hypothetical protein
MMASGACMVCNLSKAKRLLFIMTLIIISLMAIIVTSSLFISIEHLYKQVLGAICFYYSIYSFLIITTKISLQDDPIEFSRMINNKKTNISSLVSIHKNKWIGCIIFKSTSGCILVMTNLNGINDMINILKSKNTSLKVTI